MFIYGISQDLVSFFCIWLSSFPNTICCTDYPFPAVYFLLLLQKLSRYAWVYFQAHIDLYAYFYANTTALLYCFVIQFEITKCDASSFAHLSQDCFSYWGSSVVLLFLFLQKMPCDLFFCHCNFDTDCTESVDNSEQCGLLTTYAVCF